MNLTKVNICDIVFLGEIAGSMNIKTGNFAFITQSREKLVGYLGIEFQVYSLNW